jgi:replicative DNA helicase
MPEREVADRLLPQSREAERSVLGSILRDPPILGDVVQVVRSEHFYADAHQKIFDAMIALQDEQRPIDMVMMAEHLKEQKQIEDIGGYTYLGELWDAAPTAANAVYYAQVVRDKAIVRNLIHSSTEILRDAYDQSQPADELLEQAEKRILDIAQMGITGQTYSLDKVVDEAYARIELREQHFKENLGISGIATGFTDIDDLTAGLQNSELIIIAARPSVGKTAFSLNIARHVVVEEKLPALFVSLEQSRVELAERLLCCQAQVDSYKLRSGRLSHDEMGTLVRAGSALRSAKLFIDDSPGQGMLRIAANARRLKLQHQIKLVIIDYLQLIEPEDRRAPRQEQVASISRRLKFLARELQIPVVALSQLNRSPEQGTGAQRTPRLSDLRESGSIEQDADTVMLMHRPNATEESKASETGNHGGPIPYAKPVDPNIEDIDVIIAKQRNGPTGEKTLVFLKRFMRFENRAQGEHPFAG